MAKKKRSDDNTSSDPSSSSEEEEVQEQAIEEEEDEEELEAVARSAAGSDEEGGEDEDVVGEEEDEEANIVADNEIGKREKARLKEMQKMKKQKVQEILDQQNAIIDADTNNKGKGRLKYLLQQTEIFAHLAKGEHSASQKKVKGRGRHASKVTEEEEDEEYLKEEETGTGNTRLVAQPSCIQGKNEGLSACWTELAD